MDNSVVRPNKNRKASYLKSAVLILSNNKQINSCSFQVLLTSRMKFICQSLFLLSATLFFVSGCERPTDNNQTNDGVPPAVPVGVRIYYASDGEILVEWFSNTEPDLKGYNIYRKINKSVYQFLTFTTKSYYFDDSLNYEDEYFYRISALDIWGEESELSAEVSAKPINRFKPQKPRYVSINARNWEGKISIHLNWDLNEESDVAGYNIYRSLTASFTADSNSLIAFTNSIQFTDTNNLQLYTDYYYRLRAVDKGGLLSDESSLLSDKVLAMAEQIFPSNDAIVNYFTDFKIKTIELPADYKIIVQTNEYYGEFWSTNFYSSAVNDTIKVRFNPQYLYPYVYYYWRIITYTNSSAGPNSISPLYKFKVKP